MIAPGTRTRGDFIGSIVLQTFEDDEKQVLREDGIL